MRNAKTACYSIAMKATPGNGNTIANLAIMTAALEDARAHGATDKTEIVVQPHGNNVLGRLYDWEYVAWQDTLYISMGSL